MPRPNHDCPPRKEIAYVSDDINVLALVKGEERYIFLFDDSNRSETLRIMGRYASNAELSFTWYDAAILSQKVRRICRQRQHATTQRQSDFEA